MKKTNRAGQRRRSLSEQRDAKPPETLGSSSARRAFPCYFFGLLRVKRKFPFFGRGISMSFGSKSNSSAHATCDESVTLPRRHTSTQFNLNRMKKTNRAGQRRRSLSEQRDAKPPETLGSSSARRAFPCYFFGLLRVKRKFPFFGRGISMSFGSKSNSSAHATCDESVTLPRRHTSTHSPHWVQSET